VKRLRRVQFLLDTADAHGLSLQYVVTRRAKVAIDEGYQFVVQPTVLGELSERLQQLTTVPPFLRPAMIVIADLPFTVNSEQSVEAIKTLASQGVRVIVFDHHTDPKNVATLEELGKLENVEVQLFTSALKMNAEFAKFIESEFGVELGEFEKEVLVAGAVADLDCEALQEANGEEKGLARLMDYLIGTFGSTVALARLTEISIDELEYEGLIEEMRQYDVVTQSLERIKEVAKVENEIAMLPHNTQLSAINKAIAMYIAEGNARYVVNTVNSFNPRSKKYSVAVMVYASPCENIRDSIRAKLNEAGVQAKIVGHPSFVIVILKESDEPIDDEEAQELINEALPHIREALLNP